MQSLPSPDCYAAPSNVWITDENGNTAILPRDGAESLPHFACESLRVWFEGTANEAQTVYLVAPDHAPRRVHLRWNREIAPAQRIIGDHFERGYGDLEFRGIVPERLLPWYFMAADRATQTVWGWGVQTGANALCWWRVDGEGISLFLDVSCGGSGVRLGNRALNVATIVGTTGLGKVEAVAHALCRRLCPAPRLPSHIVYGSNNWYYAYGTSSHDDILRDTDILMAHAPVNAKDNPPYMVIDDGWQIGRDSQNGVETQQGPWTMGCSRFPDMQKLAREITARGARPGIWIRPLGAAPGTPEERLLPVSRLRSKGSVVPALDPSLPKNLAHIASDFETLRGWGYELIKHDWSTYDILGRWGFEMTDALTNSGWHFADRSRTTAEIINELYRTIREAAGDAVLIGCNTVGHLAAGLHELQRTGDDTSGQEWERTRKMGINTLAFRMPQHNAFFAVDADCVGLTRHVPWHLNRQWLDLLARSGTPLFVSTAPDAIEGTDRQEQSEALRAAFAQASALQPVAVPLDWQETTCPRQWQFGEAKVTYNWSEFASAGPQQ